MKLPKGGRKSENGPSPWIAVRPSATRWVLFK